MKTKHLNNELMKAQLYILCLLVFFISMGCHQMKKTDSERKSDANVVGNEQFEIPEIIIPLSTDLNLKEDTFLINNLELLGKIWGFLKYHHPEIASGKYDWDDELFQFLPEYLKVKEIGQRDETLLKWIEKYGKISPCATCRETSAQAYLKPDFLWVEKGQMSIDLKKKIMEIYSNRYQGTGSHYIRMVRQIGNPELLNEKSYPSTFLNTSCRLLALFRYWNIVQYFFPYKYLTEKNWDEVLKIYIPSFILSKTELDYQLSVLQLTSEINDTHAAHLQGAMKVDSLRGGMQAPFRVQFIENKLVVTYYYDPELKGSAGLEVGDFITHVNGKKIEYIVDSIKSYYPASNEEVRKMNLANDLVRSNSNTIHIDYNSSGIKKQKELTLYNRNSLDMRDKLDFFAGKKTSYDSILIENDSSFIGYITLKTIREHEIENIKKAFNHSKGIIIDIRNYPSTFVPFLLGTYFVSKDVPFAKFTLGEINNPGEFNFIPMENKIPKSKEPYKGILVVIVNEKTISQAEYTAMAFRAGDNTAILGSQTAGADGNVSYINLPGGLQTMFSGIGVYYPDGGETQRIGIVPDIKVKPTIKGIREGRDELLEKAIEIIKDDSKWNEIKRRQSKPMFFL